MSRIDVAVHSKPFLQVILKIFRILLVVSVIFSVVMGIIGVIVHNRCGYYPKGLGAIPTMLKIKSPAADIPYGSSSDDCFDFMSSGSVFNVVAIIWFINFIISSIINFADEFLKELFSCICGVVAMVLAVLSGGTIVNISSSTQDILYLSVMALLIVALLLIKGTIGGTMLLYATGVFLFHALAVPFVLWLISIGLRKIISGILIFLVIGAVLIGITSSSGESSSGSSSSGSSSRSRKSAQTQIDILKKNISNRNHNLAHGKAFATESGVRSANERDRKKIEELEEQLNK